MAIAATPASQRMKDSTLRFSDVAQFVGLSLMRDPKPTLKMKLKAPVTRPRPADIRNITGGSLTTKVDNTRGERNEAGFSQSSSSLPRAGIEIQKQGMQEARSLPSIPTAVQSSPSDEGTQARSSQSRRKEGLLIEQSLSDAWVIERKAQQRTEKTRERHDYHKQRLESVDNTIRRLEAELAAGEEVAMQSEQAELQSEQRSRRQYKLVDAPEAPGVVAFNVPESVKASEALGEEPEASREISEYPGPPPASAGGTPWASSNSADRLNTPLAARQTTPLAVTVEDASPTLDIGVRGSASVVAAKPGLSVDTQKDLLADNSPGKRSSSKESKGGSSAATSSKTTPSNLKQGMDDQQIVTPDISMFESEKEMRRFQLEVVRRELVKCGGTPLKVFQAINLNGSGNICSQEFGDGVKRLGVAWQQLTGLSKPRELFKLFDLEKTGVITFFELFPTERGKDWIDPAGMTTPEFWKSWHNGTRNMHSDHSHPKWFPGEAEEKLALMYEREDKNAASAVQHKTLSQTFRRMKSRGKSDARCREMLALHLPKGSGPEDLQGVPTFSHNEVNHCKLIYRDAVSEAERTSQKAIYDLRDHRHTLQKSRHNLYHVAIEPMEKEQAKLAVKSGFCGLGLGLGGLGGGKEKKAEEVFQVVSDEPPVQEQASFKQLSEWTDVEIGKIEDVFRTWMKYSDKTETILRKNFPGLLAALCPHRTVADNDINAWWDQVHSKSYAECLNVDWTVADAKYAGWRKAELGDERRAAVEFSRKQPATFDQFLLWWATSEVRQL